MRQWCIIKPKNNFLQNNVYNLIKVNPSWLNRLTSTQIKIRPKIWIIILKKKQLLNEILS
jgi:hypothetical protein